MSELNEQTAQMEDQETSTGTGEEKAEPEKAETNQAEPLLTRLQKRPAMIRMLLKRKKLMASRRVPRPLKKKLIL